MNHFYGTPQDSPNPYEQLWISVAHKVEIMNCPSCGSHWYNEWSGFCGSCGYKNPYLQHHQEQRMWKYRGEGWDEEDQENWEDNYCPKCGKKWNRDIRFCEDCERGREEKLAEIRKILQDAAYYEPDAADAADAYEPEERYYKPQQVPKVVKILPPLKEPLGTKLEDFLVKHTHAAHGAGNETEALKKEVAGLKKEVGELRDTVLQLAKLFAEHLKQENEGA